jgi:hypothetical protein
LKLNLRIFSWLIVALSASACGDNAAFQKHISEGVIIYDVTYPELDSNNLMLEMLPDEMVMTFKEDKYKSQLKTGAGIIEMSVIADGENKQLHNMVKLFSDRYVLTLNHQGALMMTDVLPPYQIKYLDGKDTLAGALCKRILIDFGAAKNESYVFAFTDDIALKSPNWCTPYHEIEGVLLDYRVENYGMNMRLTARQIIPQEVDDAEFVIDDRYKPLTRREFDDLVVKNMKIFME